jgi:hypothetical protein
MMIVSTLARLGGDALKTAGVPVCVHRKEAARLHTIIERRFVAAPLYPRRRNQPAVQTDMGVESPGRCHGVAIV